MSFTQADLFQEIGTLLGDSGHVRWTPSNLNEFLNAGLRDLSVRLPNALAKSIVLPLAEGAWQDLDLTKATTFLRATRNIVTAGPPRVGGPLITMVARPDIDAIIANWTSPDVVPYTDSVTHVCYDPADPLGFFVYPGNTGNGQIEAIVVPPITPLADGATPADASTFTLTVPASQAYREALKAYVLARCYAVDAAVAPQALQRASGYEAQYGALLGIKLKGEIVASPSTGVTQQRTS